MKSSPKVRIDLDDYKSVQNLRKNFKEKHGVDIGWISSYRKWKEKGYPNIL